MARYGGIDINADRFVWVCENCPNECARESLYCDGCEAELADVRELDSEREGQDYPPVWY